MTNKQIGLCNGIIHSASVAAGAVGGGLSQIPLSDNMIITPIQLTMTVSLGKVFGIKLDESSAKAALGSAVAAKIGRAFSQIMLGWIPGLGNTINAATAASLTEAMGWSLAKEFEKEANKSEQK